VIKTGRGVIWVETRWIRLNHGEISVMFIFDSLLTTYKTISIFETAGIEIKIGLSSIQPPNQFHLALIPDTRIKFGVRV